MKWQGTYLTCENRGSQSFATDNASFMKPGLLQILWCLVWSYTCILHCAMGEIFYNNSYCPRFFVMHLKDWIVILSHWLQKEMKMQSYDDEWEKSHWSWWFCISPFISDVKLFPLFPHVKSLYDQTVRHDCTAQTQQDIHLDGTIVVKKLQCTIFQNSFLTLEGLSGWISSSY